MRQFKLTDDQSDDFYNHMFLIDKFAEELSTDAVMIVKTWYSCFKKNKKWYWIDRDLKAFLKTITFSNNIKLVNSSIGYSYLSKQSNTLWSAGFKVSRIVELTGLPLDVVQKDTEKLWKIIDFINTNMTFIYRNYDIFTDLKQYYNSPYVLTEKYYHHMEQCILKVDEWNLEE